MALKVSGGKESGEGKPSDSNLITIRDRYQIDITTPMPDYDTAPAVAYSARHKKDPKQALFALVCDPKMPPRLDVISTVHRVDHRNLVRVLDWNVVDWPPEGRRCPVLIYERPAGKKVFPSLDATIEPFSEDMVMRKFVEPVTQVLRELHTVGVPHRNIRPDNLYWEDATNTNVVLGECSATLAGITNPAPYETRECCLASPAGRGEGDDSNDLYALGVTMLALLTGKSPMSDQTDEAVANAKLRLGSYPALAPNVRVSLMMMEPLRGLLNDDPDERWTIEDLSLWLSGRRLSPKQQVMPMRASRGLLIGGKEYSTTREIADAFHKNWDQAATVISDGSLDVWLRRSLSDDNVVDAVNEAKVGADSHDKLVAKVIIALDPEGPIRYRDFSANLDGIGPLIGAFCHDSHARGLLAKVLSMGLPNFWLEQQKKMDPDIVRVISRLEKAKTVVAQTNFGGGMERAIYELNESLPCMSPLFDRDFVPTLDFILPALQNLAETQGDEITLYIDRDIAAYIATHNKRAITNDLRSVERDPGGWEGRLAQVRIMARLQENLHKNRQFKALCDRMAAFLDPVVDRLHSRERRENARERLRMSTKSGRLAELLEIVDDQTVIQEDETDFQKAMMDYAKSVDSSIKVHEDRLSRARIARNLGGQIGSLVSLIGCLLVTSGSFIVFMMG